MKRNKIVNLPKRGKRARVNEAEQIALEHLAQYEVVTISEATRLAIRESCKARGLWPPNLEVSNVKPKS